jgi:hypothetical protein
MKAAQKLAKKDKKKGKGKESMSGIGHSPGGKFPQKPTKGQPNRCAIDGKDYYFHYKSYSWLPVDRKGTLAATLLQQGPRLWLKRRLLGVERMLNATCPLVFLPTSSEMPCLPSNHLWQMETDSYGRCSGL